MSLPEHLILVDINAAVVEAWRESFASVSCVEIVQGSFEKLPEFDAMVSPANSFGLMDGGIDLAISKFFGWNLMDAVQARIRADYFGEQPVGTAFVVATDDPLHPFLVHAPTMRVPLDIRGTDNAYLAMLAILRAVRDHNATSAAQIRTLACPGLGTATGRLEPRVAAAQMALACSVAAETSPECNWIVAKHRRDAVAATLGAEARYERPTPTTVPRSSG